MKRPLDDPGLHMDSTPGDSKGKTREKKTPKNRVEPEPEEEFSSQPDLEETSVVSIDDDDGGVEVEGQGC